MTTHHHVVMKLTQTVFAVICFILTTCCDAAVLVGSFNASAPNNYNLTTLNDMADMTVLDWSVWGNINLSPKNSMLGGSGISGLSTVGSAPNLRDLSPYNLGPSFQWSDGTPTASLENVHAGIQYCDIDGKHGGALNSGFGLTITGQVGVARQVDIWMGTHRGTTQVKASLSGADDVFYNLFHQTGNAFGWATFTFTPDSNDDVLTITSTFINAADTSNQGNSYFFATALSEGTSAVPEPASAFIMLMGFGLLFMCRSAKVVRKE